MLGPGPTSRASDVSRERMGVGDEGVWCRSGDREGDVFGFGDPEPPSSIKLRSRTEPGCIDCMRLCAPPFTNAFSGDDSPVARFVGLWGNAALSRAARSLSAACADWMAAEVPARDVMLGD